MVDAYYDAWFLSGDPNGATFANSELFQYTIWELAEDYDGTLASLDSAAGALTLNLIPGLAAAEPSIPAGYRSSTYQIQFLVDTLGYVGDQNMMLITAAVPEPSSIALLGVAGAVAVQTTRRRASKRTPA